MELRERFPRSSLTLWIGLGAVAIGLGVAPLLSVAPALSVAGLSVLLLISAVVAYPPLAAYFVIGATPLIVGMDRGLVVPLVRPNEALALILAAALIAHALLNWAAGGSLRFRLTRLDLTLLTLAATGSVIPLTWMLARGREITEDDILYAVVLWKYYALFLIVRTSVRTERQVRTCLWLSLGVGAVVGIIGILQALQLFGVPGLLASFYSPDDDPSALTINRATSTLSHSQAVADVMVFNLAIAGGLLLRRAKQRQLLLGACVLFLFGALASGQFSGVLALLVGVLALGLITKQLSRVALLSLPAGLVGALALRPVIDRRIGDIQNAEGGLPISWVSRLDNLETRFWPEIVSDYNWLLGVQTAARVRPGGVSIYIESGHTWLLWTGGIPFFIAFFVFIWIALRSLARVARERTDAVGVAGIAGFVAFSVVALTMIFDPHLTLRGSADLSFPLLALASVTPGGSRNKRGGSGPLRREPIPRHVEQRNRLDARDAV